MKFSTKALRVGQEPDPRTGAVVPPPYLVSIYEKPSALEMNEYEYSRLDNPTRRSLEENVAAMENAKRALAFGSGMAAIAAVAQLAKPGERIVAARNVYGGAYRYFETVSKPAGVEIEWTDVNDDDALERATTDNAKMIFFETPSNPLLEITDVERVVKFAKARGVLTVLDNTFATPYLQNPIDLGADVALHSATKYLNGHSDLLGGVVATNDDEIADAVWAHRASAGAIPSAFDCWLTLRSIKTLSVRMERHESNARKIAAFLADRPKIEKTYYPGLPDHPLREIGERQARGYGGMISFELASKNAAVRFLDSLELFLVAESLGGVESLIGLPWEMSHKTMPPEFKEKVGITDRLVRMSVGIEDVEDLLADIERALDRV
jgi:cystathionine beta-lyase/cystathionine gamma-synthase